MEIPTIVTSHLTLRALRIDDAADIFAYASDIDVALFTHWSAHTSIQDTLHFLHNVTTYKLPIWGIEHTQTKKIIGECGFVTIEQERAELYYALARPYWNCGLGTQAVAALLQVGFDLLHVTRIEAWIIADNIGSQRVAQKVGMHYQLTLPAHWYTNNKLHDTYIYAKEAGVKSHNKRDFTPV